MERYVEDLIRNKDFKISMKRLKKVDKNPDGMYDTWTKKEKDKHDYVSKELSEIIDGYDKLRRRCNKLFSEDYFKIKNAISENYKLDGEQIGYIECLLILNFIFLW